MVSWTCGVCRYGAANSALVGRCFPEFPCCRRCSLPDKESKRCGEARSCRVFVSLRFVCNRRLRFVRGKGASAPAYGVFFGGFGCVLFTVSCFRRIS